MEIESRYQKLDHPNNGILKMNISCQNPRRAERKETGRYDVRIVNFWFMEDARIEL